jgi:hypothetical protein
MSKRLLAAMISLVVMISGLAFGFSTGANTMGLGVPDDQYRSEQSTVNVSQWQTVTSGNTDPRNGWITAEDAAGEFAAICSDGTLYVARAIIPGSSGEELVSVEVESDADVCSSDYEGQAVAGHRRINLDPQRGWAVIPYGMTSNGAAAMCFGTVGVAVYFMDGLPAMNYAPDVPACASNTSPSPASLSLL